MKGVFISLEGIEGTGKSTQTRLLSEHLRKQGHEVVQTLEPGGTAIGMKIREILLSLESGEMDPVTELLLYNASRVQHLCQVVIPALQRGSVVITDRFSDSTVAYQGYGRGIDLTLLDSLDEIATGRLRPDLTILLDIEVETGLMRNRQANKRDRLELEDIRFHEKVRRGFLDIAGSDPGRFRVIPCTGSIDEVQARVAEAAGQFLKSCARA